MRRLLDGMNNLRLTEHQKQSTILRRSFSHIDVAFCSAAPQFRLGWREK